MWFSAIKLAINTGSHIYKKRKETKMRMADAQAAHAEKMAKGELEYSGKLLEARQSDYKDEAILIILTLPILVLAYGVFSDDPTASAKKQPHRMAANRAGLSQMLQENLHMHMYLAMMRHLHQEVKINDSQIALQPLAGLVVADI